jgi:hypothetical protein
VSVGSEWEYYDGEKSKRKVTAKLEMELGDGRKVSDCIEVTRTVLDNKKLSNITNKDYYCPEIGHVKYLFSQPSPFGDYITQTSLLNFKPGA